VMPLRRLVLPKSLLWVLFVGVLVFLLLPLIVVIPVSFSPQTLPQFPPSGLSLRWYKDFFGDPSWLSAAWLSLRLALTVAALSTVIAFTSALALVRFLPGRQSWLRALILSPLIVPSIITAIALFDVLSRFRLRGTFTALVIGHTILAFPFGVFIVEGALRQFDVTLEEAAMSLGASQLVAFRKVTLPLIAPSLFAAAVIGFITSWDEVVVALFVGGVSHQTLPMRMFEFLRTEIRPTIAAVSSLLIVAVILVILGDQVVGRLRRRRQSKATMLLSPISEGFRSEGERVPVRQ
jgi:ABC-type spermidine/putrescine transport system permease subunit II